MKQQKERSMVLYEHILKLKDAEECKAFFEDLCTIVELTAMEQRFEIASMLIEGKIYRDIMEKSNTSTATISRVNRMLSNGNCTLAEIIRREPAEPN